MFVIYSQLSLIRRLTIRHFRYPTVFFRERDTNLYMLPAIIFLAIRIRHIQNRHIFLVTLTIPYSVNRYLLNSSGNNVFSTFQLFAKFTFIQLTNVSSVCMHICMNCSEINLKEGLIFSLILSCFFYLNKSKNSLKFCPYYLRDNGNFFKNIQLYMGNGIPRNKSVGVALYIQFFFVIPHVKPTGNC